MRFWLDRGVDGLRVDTIHHVIEDGELRDNPPNPQWKPGMPPAGERLDEIAELRPDEGLLAEAAGAQG